MTDELEREWEGLGAEPHGDRRRNLFPSLTETENRLIMLTMNDMISKSVEKGFASFQKANCDKHQERTKNLELSLFGDADHRSLAGRVREHDKLLEKLIDDIQWSKRLVYTAMATGFVSLAVALVINFG